MESIMDQKVVVEVSCIVDFDRLDEEDRTENGECAVDGSYLITMRDVPENTHPNDVTEASLKEFHSSIPISCLEDFLIVARPATPHDEDAAMRASWDASFPGIEGSSMSAESGLPEPTPFGSGSHDDLYGE